MPDKNNNDSLWIIYVVVGIGVILWIVTQCSLSCSSGRRDTFKPAQAGMFPPGGVGPVPGHIHPATYNITNFPNPDFINLTVPLDRDMQQAIVDNGGEPNSDCMLNPGGQCHLASGGLGICGATMDDAKCYKTDATLFNLSDRSSGLPLSDEIKKKV